MEYVHIATDPVDNVNGILLIVGYRRGATREAKAVLAAAEAAAVYWYWGNGGRLNAGSAVAGYLAVVAAHGLYMRFVLGVT